jgi:hypothetical protein
MAMWSAPPQERPTRVLTPMPDRFRRLERTEWADANRAGAPVDCSLEGPCFDASGRLYVDITACGAAGGGAAGQVPKAGLPPTFRKAA